MAEERQIFTLKQVALSIRKVIAERYNQSYWVQAEMHKLNLTPKGHCYPELVHKEEGSIVAEMRGTIWHQAYQRISKNFADVVKEPLRDGLNLLLLVKINFHPLYGMGLEILDIDPSFSLGELQKERDETLKKLKAEGVINQNQLLPFPLLPKRVAVISMDSSKGLSDFYAVTEQNPWGYRFFFMLFPAQLNGDAAVVSISTQLERIRKVQQHFDVVLIVRGGGGEIGMHCYNHYDLAKAIATFPLPVLTGIGHSTNVTVSEMVAWRNAITPTALGEFLIQCFHNFAQPLEEAMGVLRRDVRNILDEQKAALRNELRFVGKVSENFLLRERNKLAAQSRNARSSVRERMGQQVYLLRNFGNQLRMASHNQVQNHRRIQSEWSEQLIRETHVFFNAGREQLQHMQSEMKTMVVRQLEDQQRELMQLQRSIRLVDPMEILKRGFSLTLKNGKAITDIHALQAGEQIETQVANGTIISTIDKLNEHE